MLSQPIHRDCIINAKFVAALIVIGIMLFVLGFLVMGCGLIAIGIPPTAEEFWRIVFFIITSIFYVAFWLNLAILFSLRFRQAATSALASVAVWLFFSVFYTMIVNLVAKGLSPSQMASPYKIISYQKFILGLMRLAPSELFNEATTTLLMPSVRSLGPLTKEQVQGAIPSPLPLGQSLLVVWPQLTGLIAIGITPTAEEFWRIVFFIITSIFYVAFWLNLAILFSLRFRQAATSALASVAVWLFFSVFYTMIVNLVAKGLSPSQMASPYQIISYQKFILGLMRLAPSELFNEATTTLLMPSVRSLGPLTMEQVQGAIPSPLPLGQSLLVVWPQLTGLIAATVICFAISYIMFMRREIRSR